ncbi:MAG TPA: rhodanese-like domain-containing protein [Puia sp.]|nr:rhodanese-like domain-containing protein [Puia sp.]
MSPIIKNLYGKKEDLKSIYQKGAIILDVRTPHEFKSGHAEGAINIPLDSLATRINDLKKMGKPVITCCKSGARSATAMNALANAGLEVYDGGGWTSVVNLIR